MGEWAASQTMPRFFGRERYIGSIRTVGKKDVPLPHPFSGAVELVNALIAELEGLSSLLNASRLTSVSMPFMVSTFA
jgi:hypothetical protein